MGRKRYVVEKSFWLNNELVKDMSENFLAKENQNFLEFYSEKIKEF